MCKAAALENLQSLASCCLPSPATFAWPSLLGYRNQAKCLGNISLFCCEEGRIRKSNAPMVSEPREGGREAGGAWQRFSYTGGAIGREGVARGREKALLPQPYSPVDPSVPSPAGWSRPKGDGLKKCQLEKGSACQAEESAVPSERSLECWLCLTLYNNTSFIWHYQRISCSS